MSQRLTNAKEAYLATLGALCISSAAGQHAPQMMGARDCWQPVEAVPGLYMRHLDTPGHYASDLLQTRGSEGTHCQGVRVPQAVQHTLVAGGLLWWQQSAGPEPRHRQGGDTVHLAPGEEHSWCMLEDCISIIRFTPPFGTRPADHV